MIYMYITGWSNR